ncbi:MAG: branched-chain amino acid ABC transporter permease [Bacilli bacterium]|nr:branched-chain amino acid ABC transporter permease [Bacilli bacterium]
MEKTNFLHRFGAFVKKNAYAHFIAFGLLLVIVNLLRGIVFNNFFVNTIGLFLIFSIAVLGFYVLLGYGGLASLGTSSFIGLGAFLARYFVHIWNLPFIIALVLVVIIGIILGVAVGFISLRIEGMYLAIITLVIGELLVAAFRLSALFPLTGNFEGVSIPRKSILFGAIPLTTENMFLVVVVFFVAIMALVYNLTKSPVGRAMLSMKNSESAAQTMGVNLLKYRILAFVVASILAMVAGFLYMFNQRFAILSEWNLNMSLNVLAAVVIGGTASIWGIVGGGFLIFGINAFLKNIELFVKYPSLTLIFNGLLMILVVLFYPGGLSQLYFKTKYRVTVFLKARKAKKNEVKEEAK